MNYNIFCAEAGDIFFDVGSLYDYFRGLKDWRDGRGK